MTRDLTDQERVRAIRKTLEDCGEEATLEAVEWQFRYETGRPLDPSLEPRPPWARGKEEGDGMARGLGAGPDPGAETEPSLLGSGGPGA